MFIDKDKSKQEYNPAGFGKNVYQGPTGKIYIYFVYAFIIIILAALVYFFLNRGAGGGARNGKTGQPEPVSTSTGRSGFEHLINGNDNIDGISSSSDLIKAEYLTFGNFYERPQDDFQPTVESYDLPLNIKVDVSNYYKISRKIDLDPHIEDLNNYGFAILDNEFKGEANEFFDMNRTISGKEIPIFITTDFLFYYFQNTLKQVFKEVEENAFYENVWAINKKLYEDASRRYSLRKSEKGMANDPVLEGQRLEAAYLAVILKLLMPLASQVSENVNLNEEGKFTKQEAERYAFDIPLFLTDDVSREVGLIRVAREKAKSPVMLYEKDYTTFKVPADYSDNAKLNNFYLAMKWANSVFPLYYKGTKCPNCLLDKDDWVINLIASSYLTKDFSDNQDIKNQWAVVYKFISFFSGLRSDLTYLQTKEVLSEVFGENYAIEDVFSSENPDREENFLLIQEKLAGFNFKDIEGGFDRNNTEYIPHIGMRVLQEPYWPNTFIFNELAGYDLLAKRQFGEGNENRSESVCVRKEGNLRLLYRCKGFGLDLINILYGIQSPSKYFIENTEYEYYNERVDDIKKKLTNFDDFTWNNNIYWLSLDLGRSILNYEKEDTPSFMRSLRWAEERNFNAFLGAWVNIHLTGDRLEFYGGDDEERGLGARDATCDMHNYVEPNLEFYEEIYARNDMLMGILAELGVSKKANDATILLMDFNKNLESLIKVVKKELSNEKKNDEDCRFLNYFAKLHVIKKRGEREYKESENLMGEKIDGVKLLAVIYEEEGKKILAIGPIFNYQEENKSIY